MLEGLLGITTQLRRLFGSLHLGYIRQAGGYIRQAGAICYRPVGRDGSIEVLMITSRRNRHWIIPKGHVEPGETTSEAALREAFEEAGVSGIVDEDIFGAFTYRKEDNPNRFHLNVHLLLVQDQSEDFPEKHVRELRWVTVSDAMRDTDQPALSAMFARLGVRMAHQRSPET